MAILARATHPMGNEIKLVVHAPTKGNPGNVFLDDKDIGAMRLPEGNHDLFNAHSYLLGTKWQRLQLPG
jgi:hypothetical protein